MDLVKGQFKFNIFIENCVHKLIRTHNNCGYHKPTVKQASRKKSIWGEPHFGVEQTKEKKNDSLTAFRTWYLK